MYNRTGVLPLWLTLVAWTWFMLLPTPVVGDEGKSKEQIRQEKIERRVQQWQSVFGPVDFAKDEFFEVMLYVGAQPWQAMKEFGDKKLHPNLINYNKEWMGDFFKEEFRPDVTRPTRYYWGGTPEKGPDLLEYQWQAGESSFGMLDNANMILLMPNSKSINLKPEKGIAAKDLAAFLLKVLNLPYTSTDHLITEFKLPPVLRVGDVFSNTKKIYPQMIDGWQSHIVGFVGENGVNVILFKARPGRALAGLPWVPHWLNLFENDGKTPVKREEDKRENQK